MAWALLRLMSPWMVVSAGIWLKEPLEHSIWVGFMCDLGTSERAGCEAPEVYTYRKTYRKTHTDVFIGCLDVSWMFIGWHQSNLIQLAVDFSGSRDQGSCWMVVQGTLWQTSRGPPPATAGSRCRTSPDSAQRLNGGRHKISTAFFTILLEEGHSLEPSGNQVWKSQCVSPGTRFDQIIRKTWPLSLDKLNDFEPLPCQNLGKIEWEEWIRICIPHINIHKWTWCFQFLSKSWGCKNWSPGLSDCRKPGLLSHLNGIDGLVGKALCNNWIQMPTRSNKIQQAALKSVLTLC